MVELNKYNFKNHLQSASRCWPPPKMAVNSLVPDHKGEEENISI